MSSASGYMGEKKNQEFGPRFFDMSSARMVHFAANIWKTGPRFPALPKKGELGEGGAGPLHGRVKYLYLGTATNSNQLE